MSAKHVGIRDLKNDLSRFVSRARRGEVVVVTARSVPVARLVPPLAGPTTLDALIDRGLVEPAPNRARRPRPQKRLRLRGRGPALSEYVVEQRR